MILIINTAEPKQATVALSQNGEVLAQKKLLKRFHKSEKLLSAIDNLLKKSKIKLIALKGIIVISGPGGFSAVRIGISIANALAYGLKIPIISLKLNEFKDMNELIKIAKTKFEKVKFFHLVEPFYGKKPNITLVKNRVP